jgi:hypothetical protein
MLNPAELPEGDTKKTEQVTESKPPKLMLDPSLFLSPRSLQIIFSALEAGELEGVVVPASFVEAVSAPALAESLSYFAPRMRPGLVADAAGLFRRERRIELYSAPEAKVEEAFNRNIERSTRNDLVSRILIEEWSFLTSQSWIASRIRRPFSVFVKAGAVTVEGGRALYNRVTNVLLETRPQEIPRALTPPRKLRRACKWIAIGGANAAWLLGTVHGAIASFAKDSVFLLFDP